MTRDDLELTLRREGLTRPQTAVALAAADAYATSQALLALGVVRQELITLPGARRLVPPPPEGGQAS